MSEKTPCETLHRNIPPLPAHDDPEYWRKIRAQFPMPPDEAYCNTGTIGASPLRVLHAVVDHMVRSMAEVAHVDWRGGGMSLLSGYSSYKELRTKIGELINADFSLIALTQNATMGMNLLANGLDLPAGSGVLITDIEHPGGRCGWELLAERRGTMLQKAEIPIPVDSPDQIVGAFEDTIHNRRSPGHGPHPHRREGDRLRRLLLQPP